MAHHSQTITRAKASRTAIPASTTMAEAKSNIELHRLSCQNAASGLRLDAGDAITLGSSRPGGSRSPRDPPGVGALALPLAWQGHHGRRALAGSPSRVLQLAGRFADAAVVADLQLGWLA